MSEAQVSSTHGTCPDCGANDALTTWDNGSTYCFSCEKSNKPTQTKSKLPLLDVAGVYAPIKSRCIEGWVNEKCGVVRALAQNPATGQKEPCLVFPYKDTSGEVIGQKIRFPDKTFQSRGKVSSRNPMFCQSMCYGKGRWDKTLIITEGEIDCLSVRQCRPKVDVVSLNNGASSAKVNLTENLPFLLDYSEIILWFDNDEAGRKAVEEALNVLPIERVRIVTSNHKDANEALMEGGNEAVSNAIFNSNHYKPKGVFSGEELWEVVDVDPPDCLVLPYDLLHEKLLGFRKNELTVVAGVTGGGKSTLCAELAYHLVREHNKVVGYIGLEETIKDSCERFITLELDKRVALEMERPDDEYREAFDRVIAGEKIHFVDFFGSVEIDRIFSTMRYLIASKGCEFIFLDHLTIMLGALSDAGGNKNQLVEATMTRLRTFVDETGVGLVVLCHVNAENGINPDKESKSRYLSLSEGGIPTLDNLRDSRSIGHLANNVITFGRNTIEGEDYMQLWVPKCRLTGRTGIVDLLKFNSTTGRLECQTEKKATQQDLDEIVNDYNDDISEDF